MPSDIGRSIDTLVRDSLTPVLKAAGFRKQARTFRRVAGEAVHVVNVQGSKWNAGAEGEFTINLGVFFPAAARLLDSPERLLDAPSEADCLIRRRIGHLMPGRQDHWWAIRASTDLAALGHEVADALLRHGLPWFDTMSDLHAAGRKLEADGLFYFAAVAALAAGDRSLATARLGQALARFPDAAIVRSWGAHHGLLGDAAAR